MSRHLAAWVAVALLLNALSPPASGVDDLVPGNSVFGQRHFIEYVPGELPLVLAAWARCWS